VRKSKKIEIGAVQKSGNVVELEKIMLKNAYSKIGFDTAVNELSKVGCAASYQLYLYLLSGTQNHESVRRRIPNSVMPS
jgi:hypothetical protein